MAYSVSRCRFYYEVRAGLLIANGAAVIRGTAIIDDPVTFPDVFAFIAG